MGGKRKLLGEDKGVMGWVQWCGHDAIRGEGRQIVAPNVNLSLIYFVCMWVVCLRYSVGQQDYGEEHQDPHAHALVSAQPPARGQQAAPPQVRAQASQFCFSLRGSL